jgi:hypothetical protein
VAQVPSSKVTCNSRFSTLPRINGSIAPSAN